MQYLVEMRLAEYGRPSSPQDGVTFIEQYVLPSLDICKKLEGERKILAGGPVGGSIGFAMIMEADSVQELDGLIESLPIWPRMKTTVVPLTSFDGRAAAVRPRLERLKSMLRDRPVDAP